MSTLNNKMHQRFLYKIFILIALFACSITVNAQMQLPDSAIYKQTQDNVLALYKNAVKENLHLYNGVEYVNNSHGKKGFPYFKSADWLHGSVFYDGNFYDDVDVQYDIAADELIIQDYTKNFPVKLNAEKIKYFKIDSLTFINAAMDDVSPFKSEAGFYQELYSGKSAVFAKKKKIITTTNSNEGFIDSYKEYDSYYIYYNGKIYKVSNEKSVLNVYKRKADLKKFINSNNINFKKDFETAIVKTAQFADQLKN